MRRLGLRMAWRGLVGHPLRTLAAVTTSLLCCLLVLLAASAQPTARGYAERQGAWTALASKQEVPTGTARPLGVFSREYFRGAPVEVLRVWRPARCTGLCDFPVVGQAWFSPVLRELRASEALLRERYPERAAGDVPARWMAGSRAATAIIGVDEAWARGHGGIVVDDDPGVLRQTGVPVPTVVSTGAPFFALALCGPLLWLSILAARLGASQSQRRMSALHLMGAKAATLRMLSLVDSWLPQQLGALLGVALWMPLARALAPRLPVGAALWPQDVATPRWVWPLALVVPPLVVALAFQATTWRSAAGRAARAPRLRGWLRRLGLWLTVAGLATSASSLLVDSSRDTGPAVALMGAGFVLTALGLTGATDRVLAGIGRAVMPRAKAFGWFVAARRMARNPGGGASAAAGALGLCMMVSCFLFSFFPLLSSVSAPQVRHAAAVFGSATLEVPLRSASDYQALVSHPGVMGSSLVRTMSTSTSQSVQATCERLVLRGRPACSDDSMQREMGAMLRTPDLTVAPTLAAARLPAGATVGWTAIIQSLPGDNLESVRNRAIALSGAASMSTLGEIADESANATRPFEVATLLMLAAAWLACLATTLVALVAQVEENLPGLRHLRVCGATNRKLARAFTHQGITAGIIAVMLGTAAGTILSTLFLRLNASALAPRGSWIAATALATLSAVALSSTATPGYLQRRLATQENP